MHYSLQQACLHAVALNPPDMQEKNPPTAYYTLVGNQQDISAYPSSNITNRCRRGCTVLRRVPRIVHSTATFRGAGVTQHGRALVIVLAMRGSVHLLLCYVKADSAYRWLVGRMYIRWDVERSRVGATAIGFMGRALRRSGRVFLLSTGRISFLLDCFWSVSVDHHHWWMPCLILQ